MPASPMVEEGIAIVDLRGRKEQGKSVLSLLRESVVATSSGVVDIFKVLVCDDLEAMHENERTYRDLLESALTLKLVVIVSSNGKSLYDLEERISLPESFREHSTSIRILVVEDDAGLFLATGKKTPTALAVWPEAGVDTYAVDIVADALMNPEVFATVFEKTRELPYNIFSVGTRQAWFGTVPTPAISDALTEVGKGIVGGDGFGTLERRPTDIEVPSVLSGNAVEQDILVEDGRLARAYSGILRGTGIALGDFALKTNRQVLKRVARYPNLHLASIDSIGSQIDELESMLNGLFDAVDASDGIGPGEMQVIEREGIRLFRDDSARSAYRHEVSAFFDRVVDAVVSSLRDGQSMAPYVDRIQTALDVLAPRTSDQLREEHARHSLKPITEKFRAGRGTAPSGLLMRTAGTLARALLVTWNRIMAVTIVVIGLTVSIYDLSDWDFLGGPLRDDRVWDNASEIAMAVVLVLASATAGLLVYATNRIRKWGRELGLLTIAEKTRLHKVFVEQVALNDWVLNKLRRSALEPTARFKQCIEDLMDSLRSILIDSTEREGARDSERIYNPAIRATYHAGAQTGIFHNLPLVQDILRADVVKLLQHAIESHAYSLLGGNAEDVAEHITSDASVPLRKYISSVMRHGIYSRYHTVDIEQGHNLRQQLIDKYWSDSDSVNKLLNRVVLTADDESMVQFIRAETLVQLDGDPSRTRLIRFAPRPSRLSERFQTPEEGQRLSEVVFTKSASIGGVLRLIGFREGAFI